MTNTRREFVKSACRLGIVTAFGGVSVLFTACSTIPHIRANERGGQLTFPGESFGESDVLIVIHRSLEAPIFVRRIDRRYTALLLLCTHKGCHPRASKYTLDCPCHGSQFDLKGNVLQGPAQKKLKSFPVQEDGKGNLVIRL